VKDDEDETKNVSIYDKPHLHFANVCRRLKKIFRDGQYFFAINGVLAEDTPLAKHSDYFQ